jgi:hypothetical protein
MNLFPTNSGWVEPDPSNRAPGKAGLPVGETKLAKPDIDYRTLEGWYRTLLNIEDRFGDIDVRDLEDLRDEIYSYLRG